MANWVNSVMNLGKAALERMAAPVAPDQVRVVNTTELAPIPTIDRYAILHSNTVIINKFLHITMINS